MSSKWNKLAAIDVSPGVEVKHGGIKYLSWAYAWSKLCELYPDASFERHEIEWMPDETAMVSVSVTADGQTHRMWLPVMDNKMRAMKNPDARAISDNTMRAFCKAIACHALGLSLWMKDGAANDISNPLFAKAQELISEGDSIAFHQFVHGLTEEEQGEIFGGAPAGKKTAFKQLWRDEIKKAEELLSRYTAAVQEAIAAGDSLGLAEMREELTKYEMKIVAGRLSAEEQQKAKELKETSDG